MMLLFRLSPLTLHYHRINLPTLFNMFIIDILIFFFFFSTSIAAKDEQISFPSTNDILNDQNLVDVMKRDPIHNPKTYSGALVALKGLETPSSCRQNAILLLNESCQTLSDEKVSDVRDEVVIRLALCELSEAGAKTPVQCDPFIDSEPQRTTKGNGIVDRLREKIFPSEHCSYNYRLCDTESLKSHLEDCRSAFHTNTQWWTSYSNVQNNVWLICQASRGLIERENILKIIRTSTSLNEELSHQLEDTLKLSLQYSMEIEKFRKNSLNDLKNQTSQLSDTINSLTNQSELGIQVIVDAVVSVESSLNSMFDGLHDVIENINERAEKAQYSINLFNQQLSENFVDLNKNMNITISQAQIMNDSLTTANDRVSILRQFTEEFWIKLLNFSEVISEAQNKIEEGVTRNTQLFESQVNTINSIALVYSNVGSTMVFLTLPLIFLAPYTLKLAVFIWVIGLILLTLLTQLHSITGWIIKVMQVISSSVVQVTWRDCIYALKDYFQEFTIRFARQNRIDILQHHYQELTFHNTYIAMFISCVTILSILTWIRRKRNFTRTFQRDIKSEMEKINV